MVPAAAAPERGGCLSCLVRLMHGAVACGGHGICGCPESRDAL